MQKFPDADLSYQSAAGNAICQIFVEAVKRAGAVDSAKIRDAILKFSGRAVNTGGDSCAG